jgi:energy-coupling factor transporter ATP-binding protein EcfA2
MDIGPGAADLAARRDRLTTALRSYLIPRLEDPHTPLVVVFVGPTGSGKSTLINSLTGRDLSETGFLRPTTTEPVVLASEANTSRFTTATWADSEVVTGSAPILTTMTLVDTPDIDSTSIAHRQTTETLVDVADVVVFVASTLRYADDIAWQVLRRATSRGADVINVLNRVTSGSSGAVVNLRSRLRRAGLEDHVVTIPEHHVPAGGQRIPSLAMRSLRRRLAVIASDRDMSAGSTRSRVLAVTLRQVGELVVDVARSNEDVDVLGAELSVALAGRVSGLDLSGVTSRSGLLPSPSLGWLARRRWRRGMSVDARSVKPTVQRLAGEISGLIQGDLREWMEDEHERLGLAGMHARVMSVSRPMIESSLEGWVAFARRVVSGQDGREDARAEIQEDLMVRIEVVYEQFGTLVTELLRSDLGQLDATDVRAALGMAAATALVDA